MGKKNFVKSLFLLIAVSSISGCYFSTRVGKNEPQIDTINQYGEYRNDKNQEYLALIGENYIYIFPDTTMLNALNTPSVNNELKIFDLSIRASKKGKQLLRPATCLTLVTKEFTQPNKQYESLGFKSHEFVRTDKTTKTNLVYYSTLKCYGHEDLHKENMWLEKTDSTHLSQLQNVQRIKQSKLPKVNLDKRNNGMAVAGALLLDTISLPVQIITGPNLPK